MYLIIFIFMLNPFSSNKLKMRLTLMIFEKISLLEISQSNSKGGKKYRCRKTLDIIVRSSYELTYLYIHKVLITTIGPTIE